MGRCLLLVEPLPFRPVGEAGEDDGPPLQVGKQHRSDGGVVLGEVPLGVAVGEEGLADVGQAGGGGGGGGGGGAGPKPTGRRPPLPARTSRMRGKAPLPEPRGRVPAVVDGGGASASATS